MKIIAKTDTGFLFDVSIKEMALLLGFDAEHNPDFKKIAVGTGWELPVTKFANVSSFVRNIDADKIQRAKDRLTDAIKDVDKATEEMQALYIFETLKEEHQ